MGRGERLFRRWQGWDVLVLQDRADPIRDWTRSQRNCAKLNESLRALDTFASWVQTASRKMRRRPTVLLFHRCLWDHNEFVRIKDTKTMCGKAAEGILLYRPRLSNALGPSIPVQVVSA